LLDKPIVSLFTSLHNEVAIDSKVVRELDLSLVSLRESTLACADLDSTGKSIKPITSDHCWIGSSGQPDPIFTSASSRFICSARKVKHIRWLFRFETQKERYCPQYDHQGQFCKENT